MANIPGIIYLFPKHMKWTTAFIEQDKNTKPKLPSFFSTSTLYSFQIRLEIVEHSE